MKKRYSIVLFLSLSSSTVFAAWDGTDTPWTKGDGTETNPYIIENEQQLEFFRKSVTEGETYESKYVKLAADLDMSADKGMIFNPIGFHNIYTAEGQEFDESKPFLGTFDGGYHTIDNANIALAAPDPDGIGGVGLFACAYKGTTIKNVILGSKSTVNGAESSDVAGIAGICYGGSIANCMNAATILGGSFETGGITGHAANGTIVNGCINKGSIETHSSSGGIVGTSQNAIITNCYSTGAISAEGAYMVGGIIGWADQQTTISNCYVTSAIKGSPGSSWMPGISPVVAELERSTARNCYYVEALTGCKPLSNQNGVKGITEAELKSEATVTALNGTTEGTWVLGNDGYPTLAWEAETAYVESTFADNLNVTFGISGGTVYITTDNSSATFSVYDVAGHVVYSAPVLNGSASYTPAAGGVYIAVVITPEGKAVRKISL